VRRDQPLPQGSRVTYGRWGLKEDEPNEKLLDIVDLLYELSGEVEKTVSQVALNWVLQRPSVASVTFGARTEEQLRENLGAIGWNLTPEQVARLDAVSAQTPVYPYSHQLTVNRERVPPAV
jgi:aryl-alcohol dehydrogenase-like predicted oxidoreductase